MGEATTSRSFRFVLIVLVALFSTCMMVRGDGPPFSVDLTHLYYEDGHDLIRSLGVYFSYYNHRRPHASLGYRTPTEVYEQSRRSLRSAPLRLRLRSAKRPCYGKRYNLHLKKR